MNRKRSKEVKFALGVIIIILILVMSANNIGTFLNPLKFVSEVTAQPEEYMGRNVQVVGFIVNGTWNQTGPFDYSFRLTDGNATIDVEYSGEVPGKFKPDVGITVIGTLVTPEKVLANKLLAKCPSKYEADIRSTLESKQKI